MSRPRLASHRIVFMAGITLGLALVGCSGSDSSSDAREPAASEAGTATNPQESTARAVDALLTAEQRGEFAASYALLSKQGRREFPTVSQWARRRKQLPAVTTFAVEADSDNSATATVRHEPALDAFRGLTPAQERQTWKGREVAGGWLLDAGPRVTFVLPDDDAATSAAVDWAEAVQRCDQPAARSLQAVDQLFGDATAASGLCGSAGEVVADAAGRLGAGPASADIVAQYSTDALTWSRTVDITQPVTFRVVLAPLGETWKVIGVFPATG